jgi:glycosyltransferase involved in cell wall biosynthesis
MRRGAHVRGGAPEGARPIARSRAIGRWTLIALAGTAVVWALASSLLSGADPDSLTAIGSVFALLVATISGATVVALTADLPFGADGGAPVTSVPLIGIVGVVVAQACDVLAVQARDSSAASSYLAASTSARLIVPLLLAAGASALVASGSVRRRRLIWSGWLAVVLLAAFELAPQLMLPGGAEAPAAEVATLRLLAPAMTLSVAALLMAGTLAASARLAWAWTPPMLAAAGTAAAFAAAGEPSGPAAVSLAVQVVLCGILVLHALRLRDHTDAGGVVILNWRDTANPEGGGSEVFVEEVAARLAADGRRVTLFCAAHPGAPAEEMVRGVRVLRKGSRATVYPWALVYHLTGRFGPHDVMVDVQNGVPFLSTLYCHRATIVLVHHVHREQWPLVFRPGMARLGWWLESRMAPRLYRGTAYVAVSEATRDDLVGLGVAPGCISVVHNGTARPRATPAPKTADPSILVLGRLVPHKRVEHVLEATATIAPNVPGLRVRIAGRGYWDSNLRETVDRLGIAEIVEFRGFVSQEEKAELLSSSWVLAMPSVKEGWGLVVMEAAALGTPAVGYRDAGGVAESISDGVTGLLATDQTAFTSDLLRVLTDAGLRDRLGMAARARAEHFGWSNTAEAFADVLDRAVGADAESRRLLVWGRHVSVRLRVAPATAATAAPARIGAPLPDAVAGFAQAPPEADGAQVP